MSKRLEVEITKATVLLDYYGLDTVILATTLPATVAAHPNDPLHFMFYATNGEGVEYVRRNFGIEPEVRVVREKITRNKRGEIVVGAGRRAAVGGKED